MIFPRLLNLSSADLDAGDLPPSPENCLVPVVATIGTENDSGADYFSFLVATPSGLADAGLDRWGRGILIVEFFSWDVVDRSVSRLLAQAARETWPEVAQVLNRELLWEFDGYSLLDV